MKIKRCLNIFFGVLLFTVCTTAYSADNTSAAPDPGTVQSQDTKSSSAQNNTPRQNPSPNPEPASNPPGVDHPHTDTTDASTSGNSTSSK